MTSSDDGGDETDEARARRSPKRAPTRTGDAALDRATALFADGKVDEALAALASGGGREAQALENKIKKFRQVYYEALDEHRAKNAEPAIRLLKQAKAYEAKITGGRSALADEVGRKLADMHYVAGINAYLANRLADAFTEFKSALAAFREHKPSQRKLDDLAEKAKQLYEEGYVAGGNGDPETARLRYRVVMQIVPPDHEHYRKAKQRLEALPK